MICIYVAIGQKASTVAKLVSTLKKHQAMEYTVVPVGNGQRSGALTVYCAVFRNGRWRNILCIRARMS